MKPKTYMLWTHKDYYPQKLWDGSIKNSKSLFFSKASAVTIYEPLELIKVMIRVYRNPTRKER